MIKVKDSEELKRLIKLKGYSQTTFAQLLEVSKSHLYMVTNGKVAVGADLARKITKKLGRKEIEELFEIKEG